MKHIKTGRGILILFLVIGIVAGVPIPCGAAEDTNAPVDTPGTLVPVASVTIVAATPTEPPVPETTSTPAPEPTTAVTTPVATTPKESPVTTATAIVQTPSTGTPVTATLAETVPARPEQTPAAVNTPDMNTNIAIFGDTGYILYPPSKTDYVSLGGSSAINRSGYIDSFVRAPVLAGNDWVQVTEGAARKSDGTLVTWVPGSTTIAHTYLPSDTGKKYVSLSQSDIDGRETGNDWILAIYEDPSGNTYLDAIGYDNFVPSAVLAGMPKETGWKMVAAGNNHALALRSDGTLVAWGDNSEHQLDLPTDQVYSDLAAGKDFSLALTAIDATGTGGKIVAAGNDEYRQVTNAPGNAEAYLQIAAGPSTGAALTHDGHILIWGRNDAFNQPPQDAGYTDICLAPDWGFALRENAPEVLVTGPLSPGQSIRATDGSDIEIPFGSSFDHTHNDVTRVFGPEGKEILWANDETATQVKFPSETILPLSVVHGVPSGSTVTATVPYRATVTSPGGISGDVMTVSEDAWYDEANGTLPRAMCFADKGCSVGISAKQQLFLSAPLPGSQTQGSVGMDFVPVFSVRQVSNGSYIGTLSILGSTDPTDITTLQMEKKDVDPSQPINFSVVSSNWGKGSGTNMWVTAKANLTSVNSTLQYTITATASQKILKMNITPQIWEMNETTGDKPVYTGEPVTCQDTTTCVATGEFTPQDASTYYANATVRYTLSESTNAEEMIQVEVIPVSATWVYPVTAKVTFTSSSYNVNVGDTGTVTMDINNGATVDYYTAYYMKLPPGVTYSSTAKGKNPDGTCNLPTSSDGCSVPNFETVWGPGTVLWYWDWGFGDYDKTYIINVAYTTSGTKNFISRDLAEEAALTLPSWSTDQFNVIVK